TRVVLLALPALTLRAAANGAAPGDPLAHDPPSWLSDSAPASDGAIAPGRPPQRHVHQQRRDPPLEQRLPGTWIGGAGARLARQWRKRLDGGSDGRLR